MTQGAPANQPNPSQGSGGGKALVVIVVVVTVVMIGMAVLGVLAALAIYGVRKYIINAKLHEGRAGIVVLANGIADCANRAQHLPPTSPAVPVDLTAISGKKYQSAASDWDADAFTCGGFQMSTPQYFQYQWVRQADQQGEAIALADLNGDGTAEHRLTITVRCSSPTSCRADPLAP